MRIIVPPSPDTHAVLLFSHYLPYPPVQRNMSLRHWPVVSFPLPAGSGFFAGMKAPKVCYNRSMGVPLVSPLAEEEVYECSTVPWANTPADGHDLAVDLYPPIRAGSWAGHLGACGV